MSLIRISETFILNKLKNVSQGNLRLINYDGKVFHFGDLESKLSAEKAEYSNTESFLVISKDVIIEDTRGKMAADKLFFDIEKQTLKIAAFNDNKVNANINLK